MKKILLSFVLSLSFAAMIFAHTPLMYLTDNNDGTILVECMFSDGSSASNFDLIVTADKKAKKNEEAYDGKKVLFKTFLDDLGTATIFKPHFKIKNYTLTFDAGPGHIVTETGLALKKEEIKEWRIEIRKKENKEKLGKWFEFLYGEK